ncbi:MAG: hypothetical protein ACMG6H_03550 [Acidobacteriota bacterium]
MTSHIKGDAMHLLRRVLFLSAILSGALALTACPSKTTIAKINQDPSSYQNREVGLIGTVTNSYGILGNGIYELDDGTGRIWVMTTRGVPARGARVGASGHVHTGVSFGGRTYGVVLQEEQRRTRSN